MNEQTDARISEADDQRLDRWLAAQPLLPSSPSFCDAVMHDIERQQPWWKRLKQSILKPRTMHWNIPSAAFSFILLIALGFSLSLFTGIQNKQPELAQVSNDEAPLELVKAHQLVQFQFQAPKAAHVELVGDFSQWQKKIPMTRKPNGLWMVELPLDDGSYEYAFVVDKVRLMPDPNAKVLRDDGFGNRNAVRTVTSI